MWLFTPKGFYSVVMPTDAPKKHRGKLVVRARVRGDLDNLRNTWLPELTNTSELPNRDYAFRAYCTRQQMADAMSRIALSIDYDNFKNEVYAQQGQRRESVYHKVWAAMLYLQPARKPRYGTSRRVSAFGSVEEDLWAEDTAMLDLDDYGRVLGL
jgi:hypothetical protein